MASVEAAIKQLDAAIANYRVSKNQQQKLLLNIIKAILLVNIGRIRALDMTGHPRHGQNFSSSFFKRLKEHVDSHIHQPDLQQVIRLFIQATQPNVYKSPMEELSVKGLNIYL